MLKLLLKAICLLILPVSLYAQADTSSHFEHIFEFYKVNTALQKVSNTAVSFQFTYRRSDAPGTVIDSMHADYHLDNGMMRGSLGSLYLLRNSRYTITVNPEDSTIFLTSVGAGAGTFQINIFDSLFRVSNVSGIDVVTNSNGTKTLTLKFKSSSYYRAYSMTYLANYRLQQVHLEYLDLEYDENGNPPPVGRRKIMDVAFSTYREEEYDPENFSENAFVRKDEYGKWHGTGIYSNYTVTMASPDL